MKLKQRRVLPAALCAALALFLFLVFQGVIVFDHSGVRRGEGLVWNGVSYDLCSGDYTEGRTIAKTEDGWHIREVEEDPSHSFLVLRSFLDQYLVVREDYEIPRTGVVTMVSWRNTTIRDTEFCAAITDILAEATPTFTYEAENLFQNTDRQQLKRLCVAYENCPVATIHAGSLGKIDGVWYLVLPTQAQQDASGEILPVRSYKCFEIPAQYTEVLENYWR